MPAAPTAGIVLHLPTLPKQLLDDTSSKQHYTHKAADLGAEHASNTDQGTVARRSLKRSPQNTMGRPVKDRPCPTPKQTCCATDCTYAIPTVCHTLSAHYIGLDAGGHLSRRMFGLYTGQCFRNDRSRPAWIVLRHGARRLASAWARLRGTHTSKLHPLKARRQMQKERGVSRALPGC